jgi:hypothetical protein
MGVKAMTWAWAQDLAPTTKIVLLALADFADDEGICWPSLKRIGEKCTMRQRTVQYHCKMLREVGLLAVNPRRRGDGASTSNEYHLPVQDMVILPNLVENVDDGVQHITPPPRNILQGGGATTNTPILEPSLELSVEEEYIHALRSIPGWDVRGKPHETSLVAWITRKGLKPDQLERSAIGLGKVKAITLKNYSNLAKAFQDRLNKGYDEPSQNGRQPNQRLSGDQYLQELEESERAHRAGE